MLDIDSQGLGNTNEGLDPPAATQLNAFSCNNTKLKKDMRIG